MMRGTIIKIVSDKGFGFILQQGSAEKLGTFFHCSQLVGLEFNEQLMQRSVQYDTIDTAKGPQAIEVRPLD